MKIKIAEAAEHAQVSIRTIWNWLRQYKLTKYTMSNEAMVDLGQLNAVIDAKERVAPTPQLLAVMLRRLERIERDLDVLMYAGGYSTALSFSDDQALLAYQVAQQQSKRDTFTDKDISELTTFLKGLSEEVLEVIQVSRDVLHPWKPFYELAVSLQKHLRAKKDFSTDLELQRQYMELVSARQRVRDFALVFIEADTDSAARKTLSMTLGADRVLESEILRRVLWNKTTGHRVSQSKLPDDPHELVKDVLELMETEVNDGSLRRRLVRRLEKALSLIKSEKL